MRRSSIARVRALSLTALQIIAALASSAHFLAAQELPNETERLIAAAKLWVTAKYFHPYLAYREIDWDKALADALPGIRSARNASEYEHAIQSMLDALQDPASYVRQEPAPLAGGSLRYEKRPDGTLVVSEAQHPGAAESDIQRLATEIKSAPRIVFDLRVPASGTSLLETALDDPLVTGELSRVPLYSPGQRTWVHEGLEPAAGPHSAIFHSAFHTRAGPTVAAGSSGAEDRRIAFLLDENSRLPRIGCALSAAEAATVLTESPHYRIAGVEMATVSLRDGVEAVVRLSEPVLPDGTGLPQATLVAPDRALEEALSAVSKPIAKQHRSLLPAYPRPEIEQTPSDQPYPPVEYRILAAYKIWGTFRYFFAYKDLMDEDWDEVFRSVLPKFIAAKDTREYNLTVAEMVTHVQDSHAQVHSEALSEYFGKAPVGLRLRLIEKKPVITEILDEEARRAGIQVGDIVTRVDGEDIIERFRREAKYVGSSTQQWLGYATVRRILNGPDGSTALLAIKDKLDQVKEVKLKRDAAYASQNERTGEAFRVLPSGIGYADLGRLKPAEADTMFEQFRDTKAIIFDLRGPVQDAALSIAPRLTEEKDVPTAIVTGPIGLNPDLAQSGTATSTASYFFVETLPKERREKYKGKTIALVDERTIGKAEHAGLAMEVANKTEFVGSPSAGADSDVTNFSIPGGITLDFSGRDIRHADGGKLQRLGLQPSISVSPTIAGVRKGQDEVLEKAIEHILDPEGARRVAALF